MKTLQHVSSFLFFILFLLSDICVGQENIKLPTLLLSSVTITGDDPNLLYSFTKYPDLFFMGPGDNSLLFLSQKTKTTQDLSKFNAALTQEGLLNDNDLVIIKPNNSSLYQTVTISYKITDGVPKLTIISRGCNELADTSLVVDVDRFFKENKFTATSLVYFHLTMDAITGELAISSASTKNNINKYTKTIFGTLPTENRSRSAGTQSC